MLVYTLSHDIQQFFHYMGRLMSHGRSSYYSSTYLDYTEKYGQQFFDRFYVNDDVANEVLQENFEVFSSKDNIIENILTTDGSRFREDHAEKIKKSTVNPFIIHIRTFIPASKHFATVQLQISKNKHNPSKFDVIAYNYDTLDLINEDHIKKMVRRYLKPTEISSVTLNNTQSIFRQPNVECAILSNLMMVLSASGIIHPANQHSFKRIKLTTEQANQYRLLEAEFSIGTHLLTKKFLDEHNLSIEELNHNSKLSKELDDLKQRYFKKFFLPIANDLLFVHTNGAIARKYQYHENPQDTIKYLDTISQFVVNVKQHETYVENTKDGGVGHGTNLFDMLEGKMWQAFSTTTYPSLKKNAGQLHSISNSKVDPVSVSLMKPRSERVKHEQTPSILAAQAATPSSSQKERVLKVTTGVEIAKNHNFNDLISEFLLKPANNRQRYFAPLFLKIEERAEELAKNKDKFHHIDVYNAAMKFLFDRLTPEELNLFRIEQHPLKTALRVSQERYLSRYVLDWDRDIKGKTHYRSTYPTYEQLFSGNGQKSKSPKINDSCETTSQNPKRK